MTYFILLDMVSNCYNIVSNNIPPFCFICNTLTKISNMYLNNTGRRISNSFHISGNFLFFFFGILSSFIMISLSTSIIFSWWHNYSPFLGDFANPNLDPLILNLPNFSNTLSYFVLSDNNDFWIHSIYFRHV